MKIDEPKGVKPKTFRD